MGSALRLYGDLPALCHWRTPEMRHAWRGKVGDRIKAIRRKHKVKRDTLTHPQARALSGAWYTGWVDRQLSGEDANDLEHWRQERGDLLDSYRQAIANASDVPWHPEINPDDFHDDADALDRVLPWIADRCETSQFLHAHNRLLDEASRRYVVLDG